MLCLRDVLRLRPGAHLPGVRRALREARAHRPPDLVADTVVVDLEPRAGREVRRERVGGRAYDPADRDRELGPGDGRAVRFKVPTGGSTRWVDLIRGEISFEHEHIEDFVIRRADGSPTFFVANACDDASMAVTHVIRGEDLINVTPKQMLLREALGLEGPDPVYAHLPLIVNEQRKKLSKRRDDVSLLDYRDRGFLPSAMVNYLALLGWGPPDGQEVRLDPLDLEDGFPSMFEITDVSPSPAYFDTKKLLFVNGEHIRAMPAEEFARAAEPFVAAAPWADRFAADAGNQTRLEQLLPEVQTRVETLAEVPGYVDFVFLEEPEVDQRSWDKAMVPDAGGWLDAVIEAGSVNTREPDRDAHLRSGDFFDAAAHPAITFRSRQVNNIAGNRWCAISEELEYSVPVCGDDMEAKQIVMDLVDRISYLKAFDAGPLSSSHIVESITPLLLNVARFNKMKDVGIRFV